MQAHLHRVGWITVAVLGLLSVASAQAPQNPPTDPAAATPTTPETAKPVRGPQDIGMAELLDDPKKLAVFRKHAPDIADNPQIGQARGMSLADVAGYASEILTPGILKAIAEDLTKL